MVQERSSNGPKGQGQVIIIMCWAVYMPCKRSETLISDRTYLNDQHGAGRLANSDPVAIPPVHYKYRNYHHVLPICAPLRSSR